MDSSSIVCMADALAASGLQETPKLDTASLIMTIRNRTGMSPLSSERWSNAEDAPAAMWPSISRTIGIRYSTRASPASGTPASGINFSENADYVAHLRSGAYQVLLSGIGGDEVLGGVPTPIPELADLLVGGRVRNYITRLTTWAVSSRVPAVHLLRDTLRLFLPSFISRDRQSLPPWLCGEFVKRNTDALKAYPRRFRFFGSSPSFQANLIALRRAAKTDRGDRLFTNAPDRTSLSFLGQGPARVSLRHTSGSDCSSQSAALSYAARPG